MAAQRADGLGRARGADGAAPRGRAWWGVALGPPIASVAVLAEDGELLGRVAALFGCTRPRHAARGDLRIEGGARGRAYTLVHPDGRRDAPLSEPGGLVGALDLAVERHVAGHLPPDFRLVRGAAVLDPGRRARLLVGDAAEVALAVARLCERGHGFLGASCVPVRTDPPSVGRWRRPLALPTDRVRELAPLSGASVAFADVTWCAMGTRSPATRQRLFPLAGLVVVDPALGDAPVRLAPDALGGHLALAHGEDAGPLEALARAVPGYAAAPTPKALARAGPPA